MARIRTVKPEFPISESMGRIGREARLLYVNLWTAVDDEGRTRGSSRMLASLLYPYDDDAPTLIDGWLGELEREGCVRRYEVDGSTYLDLPNWLKHQRIDKPSKSRLPAFEDGSRVVAKPREDSTTDLGPWTMDQDLGPRNRIMELSAAAQPVAHAEIIEPNKSRKTKAKRPLPEAWKLSKELWEYGTSLGLGGDQVADAETRIKLWCADSGRCSADWDAFAKKWLLNDAQNQRTNGHRTGFVSSAVAGIASRIQEVSRADSAIEGMFEGLTEADSK